MRERKTKEERKRERDEINLMTGEKKHSLSYNNY